MPNFYKETARGNSTVRIDDSLYSNRELFLTTGIDPCSSSEFIKQLMFLDRQDNSEITLYINSPGGDVVSGLAVYDFINTLKSPVRTVCIGTAASMGAIIFLAGKKRDMLPNSIETIDTSVFEDCISLTSVVIPEKVTAIDRSVFAGCKNLTNVVLHDNIETIDTFAFEGCTKLRNLALPDSVKTCYRISFDGCTALTVTYKGKEYNHQSFDKLESAVKNNH